MLHMIRGCQVPEPSLLFEGFQRMENGFFANVHAERIDPLFRAFLERQEEELFFFLELPTNQAEEKKLRDAWSAAGNKGDMPLHKDVYYWDGIGKDEAFALLDRYGELLIQDGMASFGFGNRSFSAELMKGKYNVLTLYAKDKEAYAGFFPAFGLREYEDLPTAWDTFTREAPGNSRIVKAAGLSVYELPELLREKGLYFAERRAED